MTQADISKGFRIKDKVAVKLPEGTVYMEIVASDPLLIEKALDTVAAGASTEFVEINELNPPEDELIQVDKTILMKGNVKLLVKQPAGVNRFGSSRSAETGFLNDKFDTLELSLFILNNLTLNIKATNDTPVSITPVLKFLGHRYRFRKLKDAEVAEALRTRQIRFVSGTGIGG